VRAAVRLAFVHAFRANALTAAALAALAAIGAWMVGPMRRKPAVADASAGG
jgi:hypothetical protein